MHYVLLCHHKITGYIPLATEKNQSLVWRVHQFTTAVPQVHRYFRSEDYGLEPEIGSVLVSELGHRRTAINYWKVIPAAIRQKFIGNLAVTDKSLTNQTVS